MAMSMENSSGSDHPIVTTRDGGDIESRGTRADGAPAPQRPAALQREQSRPGQLP